MWRRLVLCGTLVALPACHRFVWTKPGFNAADWQRDTYECERDARMSVLSFGGGIVGALNQQDFFNRCLVAHGYYQVEQQAQSYVPPQQNDPNARARDNDFSARVRDDPRAREDPNAQARGGCFYDCYKNQGGTACSDECKTRYPPPPGVR